MAAAGKSDAELLEMIYQVKSPSQKTDNSEEFPDNFESERNELPVSDIKVESDTHENVPISDNMLETNSIKQESFSVNSFESLVTLPETSQNEINSSVESKMDSVPMEFTSEYSGNVETASSALPTLADSDTNQIIYGENPNFAVKDDCFSLFTLAETNQCSDQAQSTNFAVKEEINTNEKVTTLQHGASSNDELYHLTKEELVENLISCRKELDSLRKQLTRSERQLTKSDDYNELLREKVEALSSQIHSYKKGTYTEAGIQVDQNDLINYTIGEPCMPDWGVDTAQGNTDPTLSTCSGTDLNESKMPEDSGMSIADSIKLAAQDVVNKQEQHELLLQMPEDSGMSIADSIKMAAQDVVNKQEQNELLLQGYVYDETYGLYYHPQTGYYYDSEKMLYYEPHSGTYYYYDYDTGQYAFHSQVNVQDSQYAYNQTTTQHKKETSKPTEKTAVQKKKKTIESKRRKGGLKVEEQVFKNRQERRKAMREEKEKELKREEEKRKQKEKDRKKRKSSKKKKKKKSNEEDMDSDEDDSKHDRKKKKSSKKHKKHKKKHKKDKKSKMDAAREDIEKPESNSITTEITNGVKADILSDTIAGAIEVSDEELLEVVSEEEGELNDNEFMDVDQHANDDREVANRTDKTSGESYNEMEIVNSELIDQGQGDKGRTITEHGSNISESEEETKEHTKENPQSKDDEELDIVDSENLKEKRDYESISDDSESSFTSESESGEISNSSTDQSAESTDSEDDVYVVSDNENNEIEEETYTEDIVQSWRPCVRVIVTESDCLAVGMLFIITYQGMSIGRGKENGICVPDINVSKFHADVKYDEDDRNYTIIDKGSQNGTFINNERISMPKEASAPRAFKHGDVIQVADTKLLCHIHSGMDTCDNCEPGIVMARYKELHPKEEVKFVSKDERKKLQRQQLNEIKKRYGLKNAAYEDPSIQIKNLNYEDKAAERRKTVGSDTPHVKHETPASVHRPISAENKGHKMLAKMGWKEGESLGKNNSGIQEPISVSFRINQSAGLGSGVAGAFSVDDVNTVDVKKASRRMQALQRYTAIEKADGDSAGIVKAKEDNKATEGVSGDNVANDKKVKGFDNNSAVNVQSSNKYKMAWTKGATEFT